jgi:hypothetical protein
VLCLVATLAVAAEEGMEMTCVRSDGKGNCVVGKMPDGNDLVLVGSGLKVGEKMVCHHRENLIHCTPRPAEEGRPRSVRASHPTAFRAEAQWSRKLEWTIPH